MSKYHYGLVGVLILILVFLLILSCSKSTIIDKAIDRTIDTTTYTPRKRQTDTTENKVPISFDVSIDNWGDEENQNLN